MMLAHVHSVLSGHSGDAQYDRYDTHQSPQNQSPPSLFTPIHLRDGPVQHQKFQNTPVTSDPASSEAGSEKCLSRAWPSEDGPSGDVAIDQNSEF